MSTDGAVVPYNFLVWYENDTYNPFSKSVQYAPGKFEGGSPALLDISNLTPDASHGITSGDGSPQAATYLWSCSAFFHFENIDPYWIRAVEGSWKGRTTLTVWGKLSWGANPLAASTPDDGIPDGARVNPLYTEDLQVNFADGGANLDINGNCARVPVGSSYALRVWVNGTESPPVVELAGAYSQQTNVTNSTCLGIYNGNPVAWTIPVDNTVQVQDVTIQMALNTSSNSSTGYVPVNGASRSIVIPIDMLNAPPTLEGTRKGCAPPFLYNGAASWDNTSASLLFSITAVSVGQKDTTFLWLPNGNSTVNPLPGGLQRYTGAQNFALIVVNASYGVDPTGIPTPWGSSYYLPLATGLNNFLIPMVALASSPLGQALLLGKVAADSNSSTPPLLQTGDAGSLIDGGGSATLSDLACYWQNRAVTSGSSVTPLCSPSHASDKGVTIASGLRVAILNATPGSCTINCGTVPTNPQVENGTYALPALGTMLALNATNTSMLYALLAGVLDNSTGGVNGTFETLQPYQLATLGLPEVVLDALANASTENTPIFGPPTSHKVVQHQNSCSGFVSCAAQAWNSFAGAVVSGLTEVASFAWSTTFAITYYFANLVVAAARLLDEYVIQPTASAIATVGAAIVSALNALLNYILSLVKAALATAINPLLRLDVSYSDNLANVTTSAEATFEGGSISRTAALNFWAAFGGSIFEIALAIAVAIDIVIALVIPFSLGSGFLVGVALSIAFTAAMQSMMNQEWTKATDLGQYSTLNSGLSFFVENATNTTAHKPQGTNQSFWNTVGSAFAWAATLESFQISTFLLAGAFISHIDVGWQTAGFILAVVSLLLDLGAVITGNTMVKDLAVGFSGGGVALDLGGLARDFKTGAVNNPYTRILDSTVTVLDTSSLAVSWGVA